MPRLIIAATCAALTLALTACGDDDTSDNPVVARTAATETTDTPAATRTAPAGRVVDVSMKDIKFVPEKITVRVGQRIHWTNDDQPPHNVTATDGADFASDTINPGGTYDYTPKKAGDIKYVCTIHPGQNGEITVVTK